jgi:DNA-directed RNA polymerase subunit RPC12/RpoP
MKFFNNSDQKISWLHLFVGEMEATFDQLSPEGMGWVQMKNGLFKCLECTRTFQHNRTARRHFKEKHGQSSKIECQYCGTTFCRKENLLRHISKFHNTSNINE